VREAFASALTFVVPVDTVQHLPYKLSSTGIVSLQATPPCCSLHIYHKYLMRQCWRWLQQLIDPEFASHNDVASRSASIIKEGVRDAHRHPGACSRYGNWCLGPLRERPWSVVSPTSTDAVQVPGTDTRLQSPCWSSLPKFEASTVTMN